jgi:hypothetical protein
VGSQQVRFNSLQTQGKFRKAVGKKTTIRFLNHARSMATCKVRPVLLLPSPFPWGGFSFIRIVVGRGFSSLSRIYPSCLLAEGMYHNQ